MAQPSAPPPYSNVPIDNQQLYGAGPGAYNQQPPPPGYGPQPGYGFQPGYQQQQMPPGGAPQYNQYGGYGQPTYTQQQQPQPQVILVERDYDRSRHDRRNSDDDRRRGGGSGGAGDAATGCLAGICGALLCCCLCDMFT